MIELGFGATFAGMLPLRCCSSHEGGLGRLQADLKQFRELQATRRAEEKHNAEAAAKHTAETAATPQPEPVAPTKTLTAAPVPPTTQASESTPLSPENGFVFSGLPTEAEIRAILEATPPGLMRNDTANITAGM